MLRLCTVMAVGLLFAAPPAPAIGIRTHAEMAERGMDDFLLTQPDGMLPGLHAFFRDPDNRRAVFSGAAWTDWGYGGVNPDAGEDGHWFPFLQAYADLLRERHTAPFTPEAQREIAFFLGTLSHSVTDLPWHFGNGTHPSFIQAATAGDGSGHSECDFGSDVFTHTSQAIEPEMTLDNFYFPVDTIHAAYQRFGHPVARAQVVLGSTRQRTVWLTGKHMAGVILARHRAMSPWVEANMEHYYYGGVRHNAAANAHWFRRFYAWFHGGACLQNSPEYVPMNWLGPRHAPGYVPYAGVRDVTLRARDAGHNAGAEPWLQIAGDGPEDRVRTLLRFDLAGQGLTRAGRATLWLYWAARDGAPADKEVACVAAEAPWEPGTQQSDPVGGWRGQVAQAGALTWASALPGIHAPQAAGEREAPVPGVLDTVSIGADAAPGRWIAWDVTAAAERWLADPASNHGLVLFETGASAARPGALRCFASEAWKNQADGLGGGDRVNYRPLLVIWP
jgi:hypothetical protein